MPPNDRTSPSTSIFKPARISIAPPDPTMLLTSTALPGSIVNSPSGGLFGKFPTVIFTVPPLPVPLRLLLEMHAPATCAQLRAPAGAAVPVPRMLKSPLTVIVMLPPVVAVPVLSALISLPDCISMLPSGTSIVMAFPLTFVPLHLMLPVLVISKSSPAGSDSAYGHGAVTGVEIVHSPTLCTPPPATHAADANASLPNAPSTTTITVIAITTALSHRPSPLIPSMSLCLLYRWFTPRGRSKHPASVAN